MKRRLAGAGAILMALALWESAVLAEIFDRDFLTPPTEVVPTLWTILSNGELAPHVLATAERIAVGFGISTVLGIVLGIICGMYAPAQWTIGPVVETIRAIPSLALLPVFMLFFGIGFWFPTSVIIWVAWVPIFLSTVHGVRSIPRSMLDAASQYTHGWGMARTVIFPMSTPAILTGLRLGMGNAFIVIVVAEMIGTTEGIGFYIFNAHSTFHIPEMYATIAFLGGFAWAVNALLVMTAHLLWPYIPDVEESL